MKKTGIKPNIIGHCMVTIIVTPATNQLIAMDAICICIVSLMSMESTSWVSRFSSRPVGVLSKKLNGA